MDKTIRILLAAGIGILFPVLVLFACITIFPKPASSSPPQPPVAPYEPSCTTFNSDNTTNSSTAASDYDCNVRLAQYRQAEQTYQQQQSQFEKDSQSYYQNQTNSEHSNVQDRAITALVAAVLAIALCVPIRHNKELAGGLAAGSALIVFVAVSYLLTAIDSRHPAVAPPAVTALAMAALTGVLYAFDKCLVKTVPPITAVTGGFQAAPVTHVPAVSGVIGHTPVAGQDIQPEHDKS